VHLFSRRALVVVAVLGCLAGAGRFQSSAAPEALTTGTAYESPAGNLPAGPRANGTGVLPDGRFVTPVGRQLKVELQPLDGVLSADGRRLYVSSEGIDDDATDVNVPGGPGDDKRFITVVDTKTLATTKIRDDALHYGLAETSDGKTLYVSEGKSGTIGVYSRTGPADDPGAPGAYTKAATIALDSSAAYPWGLVLSPRGDRLYAVGFESDELYAIDTASKKVVGQATTGNYPYAVAVSPDGKSVYVSNWGLYNQAADKLNPVGQKAPLALPPLTIGGYNTDASSSVWTFSVSGATPSTTVKTRIGRSLNGDDVIGGSLPSALSVSPDGKRLAVTSSNDDLVQILDVTKTDSTGRYSTSTVDLRVIAGGPTGSQPDALAWTPDGQHLLVGEGGRNSVAVVDATHLTPDVAPLPLHEPDDSANRGAVLGRLPTGWYPTAVAPTKDGDSLWVVNNMGLGSGPNAPLLPQGTQVPPTSSPDAAYIPNTLFGSVQQVDLRWAIAHLASLTAKSDADNGLTPAPTGTGTAAGDGAVVPTHFGAGPSPVIKHVFLIIKENRPYDQVFGDVPGTERDQTVTAFPEKITPNAHALAARFGLGDNFYANSETSVDGHYSVDTGQINEFVLKTTPSSYAGKFTYDTFQTQPENLPMAGFIWDNSGRHGVPTRVWGEGTYVVGAPAAQLGKDPAVNPQGALTPGIKAANVTYDPLYPSQVDISGSLNAPSPVPSQVNDLKNQVANTVYPFNDEGRAAAFTREMQAFKTTGVMPNLNVMLLFDDHTAGYVPGAKTPEDYVAENDHGLGEIVDQITHSPFWKDSAIFVTEDDTQGGVDHVDAHRSFGLVISPYSKGGVSHQHVSFSSMTKTIDLLLGVPPTSSEELTASSLAGAFIDGSGHPDFTPFTALPNTTFQITNPTPTLATNAAQRQAAELSLQLPSHIDGGGELAPEVQFIGHQGALEAGDPNVSVQPNVVEHALPNGGPVPPASPSSGVTEAPPDPDG
jgi:YVTN family beta-propeller protein